MNQADLDIQARTASMGDTFTSGCLVDWNNVTDICTGTQSRLEHHQIFRLNGPPQSKLWCVGVGIFLLEVYMGITRAP